MAASAQARDAAQAPRRRQQPQRVPVRPAASPASRTRRRPVVSSRHTRAFVVFVLCVAVLAAGRVAMSFAVVQKTVATDAVASEERRVAAENAQLQEELAHLGSIVRIRSIAENRLGLIDVDTATIQYLAVAEGRDAKASTRP